MIFVLGLLSSLLFSAFTFSNHSSANSVDCKNKLPAAFFDSFTYQQSEEGRWTDAIDVSKLNWEFFACLEKELENKVAPAASYYTDQDQQLKFDQTIKKLYSEIYNLRIDWNLHVNKAFAQAVSSKDVPLIHLYLKEGIRGQAMALQPEDLPKSLAYGFGENIQDDQLELFYYFAFLQSVRPAWVEKDSFEKHSEYILKALASVPQTQLAQAAKASLRFFANYAYIYSEMGRTEYIKSLHRNISSTKNFLRFVIGPKKRKELKKALESQIKELEEVKKQTWDIEQRISHLQERLRKDFSLQPSLWLEEIMEQVHSEFLISFDKTLHHGDVFLVLAEGGIGDLFSSLVKTPNAATHAGILMLHDLDGFPIWMKFETGRPYTSPPKFQGNHMFFSPNFPLPDYFNMKMVRTLQSHGKFGFDPLFNEGVLNNKGQVSLYCSELVHFAFKNGFTPKQNLSPSPYDPVALRLETGSETGDKNLEKMGIATGHRAYPPAAIMFSNLVDLKGVSFLANQPVVFESEESQTQAPSASKIFRKTKALLHRRFTDAFRQFNMKPISPINKAKVDATVFAVKAADRFFPHRFPRIGRKASFLTTLPNNDGKYYILALLQKYDKVNNHLTNSIYARKTPETTPDSLEQVVAEVWIKTTEALADLFIDYKL